MNGLKVHLSEVQVARRLYRVVTLRPATPARFSTNLFHATWHILTDSGGVVLLSHLLWWLAFQRQPGTVVMIAGAHLAPTPFEADPPNPILLVPTGVTAIDADSLRRLRVRLRRPHPSRTVRLHTFGLARALSEDWQKYQYAEVQRQHAREHMQKLSGFICYSAPPDILRLQSRRLHFLDGIGAMGYHYLAAHGAADKNGEVQTFDDFRDMVSSATVARRQILGTSADCTQEVKRALASEGEREAVQQRARDVLHQLRAQRRRPARWSACREP